jgi:metal-responsive CopG/Arc/MetJ family transcriptional regulator
MAGRPKQDKKFERDVVYLTQEMLDELTALAKRRGFTGRSTLIRYVLTQYLNEYNK